MEREMDYKWCSPGMVCCVTSLTPPRAKLLCTSPGAQRTQNISKIVLPCLYEALWSVSTSFVSWEKQWIYRAVALGI